MKWLKPSPKAKAKTDILLLGQKFAVKPSVSSGPSSRSLLLFLFLLFLPNQLGLHFWPQWTKVQGLRIDYLSPTLYSSLLLLIPLVSIFLKRANAKPKHSLHAFLVPIFLLLSIPFILTTSRLPPVSLGKYNLFLIFLILFLVIRKFTNTLGWCWSGLAIAAVWASLLGAFQFLSQRSLGLWLIGERDIFVNTPGAATAFLDLRLLKLNIPHGLFLRPYSSFSHPNSFAGFMLISYFLIQAFRRSLAPPIYALGLIFSVIAIFLSGSRVAIATLVFLNAISLSCRFLNFKQIFLSSLLLVIISPLFVLSFTVERLLPPTLLSNTSIARRVEENRFAVSLLASKPIFGVGLGNFIPSLGEVIPSIRYPSLSSPTLWLQPVHNIYLLISSETGAIGMIITAIIIFLTLRRVSKLENAHFLFALTAIIITGMFDHYWLTLIQNQLILTLTLGLIWRHQASGLVK